MALDNLKMHEIKSFNKNEFFTLDNNGERLWELKKQDSIVKRIINFILRVKLPSTYFLFNKEIVTHSYVKQGNKIFIKEIETGIIQEVAYSKSLGDRFYKWDNNIFEISSSFQTSVVVKENDKVIGDIYFHQTKSGVKETEIVISLKLKGGNHSILPIIILLYVNGFYQDRLGQVIN